MVDPAVVLSVVFVGEPLRVVLVLGHVVVPAVQHDEALTALDDHERSPGHGVLVGDKLCSHVHYVYTQS